MIPVKCYKSVPVMMTKMLIKMFFIFSKINFSAFFPIFRAWPVNKNI